MNITDDIIIKMITKYMNTLGNKHINKMSCSDVKYNFSIEIADLFDYDSKWDFEDFLRDSYDYMVMIDSEVPVPVYLCEDYRKKYVKKNENIEKMNTEEKKWFTYIAGSDRTVITPHVAGWTLESYRKISEVLLKKIKDLKLNISAS